MIPWLRPNPAAPDNTNSVVIAGRNLPLAIRRHPTARRLILRLAPDGSEVRITMPKWGRTLDALAFVEQRKDWLETQLSTIPRPAPPVPGGTIFYRGAELTIDWAQNLPRKPQLGNKTLRLGGTADTLPGRLSRWLQTEALHLLDGDLAFYCNRANVEKPDLRLSRARRRWGSCSAETARGRCIRINWRLVQAPDMVRRSVVAHEVAHLVHFDHSPAFHTLVRALFEGDLASSEGWLKREGMSLYATFG